MNAAEFDWSRRRILVIEDDAETLDRIRKIFSAVRVGALEIVRDGGEAVAALKRGWIDLVLMEANPGGTDGLDTLRAIRGKDSPNKDVIVAVMVSMADAERLRRMCGIGIESFVRKPVNETLLQRVAQAITAPKRFVSSLSYFGPDRRKPRQPGDPPYIGPEKRRAVKTKERDSGKTAQVVLREDVIKRSKDDDAAAAPPPAAPPRKPAVRKPEAEPGDKTWFEGKPMPGKPELSDNIPLVDEPAPKKQISGGAIEVPSTATKKGNGDGGWAAEMAAKEAAREQEAGFDVAGLVSGHADWLSSGGSAGTKAMVENEDLSGAQLQGANMSGATLRNVRLSGANLRAAVFQSTDLRGSDLSGADLTDGDFTSSNLRRVDLSAAKLTNTKMAGVDLAGASLRGALLEGTDLRGANLLDADIASTDLSTATGLIQAQINKTRPNVHTVLPPGLRRPAVE